MNHAHKGHSIRLAVGVASYPCILLDGVHLYGFQHHRSMMKMES